MLAKKLRQLYGSNGWIGFHEIFIMCTYFWFRTLLVLAWIGRGVHSNTYILLDILKKKTFLIFFLLIVGCGSSFHRSCRDVKTSHFKISAASNTYIEKIKLLLLQVFFLIVWFNEQDRTKGGKCSQIKPTIVLPFSFSEKLCWPKTTRNTKLYLVRIKNYGASQTSMLCWNLLTFVIPMNYMYQMSQIVS